MVTIVGIGRQWNSQGGYNSWSQVDFQVRVPGWPDVFPDELRVLDPVKPNSDHSDILCLSAPLVFRHRLVLAVRNGEFDDGRPGTSSAR